MLLNQINNLHIYTLKNYLSKKENNKIFSWQNSEIFPHFSLKYYHTTRPVDWMLLRVLWPPHLSLQGRLKHTTNRNIPTFVLVPLCLLCPQTGSYTKRPELKFPLVDKSSHLFNRKWVENWTGSSAIPTGMENNSKKKEK